MKSSNFSRTSKLLTPLSLLFVASSMFNINAYAATSGRKVVSSSSTTEIEAGTTFTGNSTATYTGGAINNYGTVTVNNGVIFTSNSSASSYGGAISSTGTLTIKDNVEFYSNTANTYGGAIANWSIMNIGNYAYFEGNSGTLGGAILNSYSSSYGSTSETRSTIGAYATFYDNEGTIGGAILNKADLTIGDNAKFESNESTLSEGGAIFNEGTLEIGDNVKFIENTASTYGGAIANWSTIDIGDNAYFEGNKGTIGGAILNAYSSSYGSTSETRSTIGAYATFYDNEGTQGGAIQNEATLTIGEYAIFENNDATTGAGGAIYNTGSLTIGNYAKFYYNNALDGNGGAIQSSASFTLYYAYFEGNTSTAGGGAIYLNSTSNYLAVYNSEFVSNIADSGGAIAIFGKGNIISGTSFYANSAENATSTVLDGGDGGAILLGGQSTTTIIDSVFDSNTTHSEFGTGGAIGMRGWDKSNNSSASLDITGSTFTNNSATESGGAIENNFYKSTRKDDYVYVGTSIFTSNSAIVSGGAIYNSGYFDDWNNATGNAAAIWVEDSTFTSNTSALGGAIYNGGDLVIASTEGNDILNIANKATDDASGGFLYMAAGYKEGDTYYSAEQATATFNTAENSSITIGDGTAGEDSIASEDSSAVITKTGAGELIVNSSMEYYYGSLSVDVGEMTINNVLGASSVTIESGAALTMGISDSSYESAIFTNVDLTGITGSGTLTLAVTATASAETYTVFANENVNIDNITASITTFGGTVSDNTFTVSATIEINSDEFTATTIVGGERFTLTSTGDETTSVYLAFSSDASGELATVSENTTIFEDYIKTTAATAEVASNLISAVSYAFDIDFSGEALVSLLIGEGYDISQFTIYHLGDEEDAEWVVVTPSNLSYDDEYISFVVSDFCSYGVAVTSASAVPEPSTYALILGIFSLGFVAYRRRK